MIGIDVFLCQACEDSFNIRYGLVCLALASAFCLTIHLVVNHGVNYSLGLELSGDLPAEMICFWKTNFLSLEVSEEKKSLENLRIPHDSVFLQILNETVPFFTIFESVGNDREILVFVLNLYQLFISYILFLSYVSVEVNFVLVVLLPSEVLSLLLEVSYCFCILLWVSRLSAKKIDSLVTISCQIVLFTLFPYLNVSLYCFKSKAFLLISELTVLTHRIEADHILPLLSFVRSMLDLLPFSLRGKKFSASSCCISLLLLLVLVKLITSYVLFSLPGGYLLKIPDRLFQGFICHTAIVDQRNCHVGAKPWNSCEVHTLLPHYFLDVNVLETFKDVFLNRFLLLCSLRVFWLFFEEEHIMCNTRGQLPLVFLGVENLTNHKLMVVGCPLEFEHLICFIIEVSIS